MPSAIATCLTFASWPPTTPNSLRAKPDKPQTRIRISKKHQAQPYKLQTRIRINKKHQAQPYKLQTNIQISKKRQGTTLVVPQVAQNDYRL